MKLGRSLLLSVVLLLVFNTGLHATHNRAGEILYELVAPLTYRATIVTYTDLAGILADRDSLQIMWGDGTTEFLKRVNGPDNDGNGIPDGEIVGNDVKKNLYEGLHQYPGALPFYVVSVMDPNRNDGICNMSNSVQTQFYLEDTIFFQDPAIFGFNTSPILLSPPIDFGSIQDTFYHNPNAWDPDGDSLSFTPIVSLAASNIEVLNYRFPDELMPGPDNNYSVNPITGEIIWAVPPLCDCEINIAVLIREFRNGVLLSTLMRDLQILVKCLNNDPPQIQEVRDTCIWAGELLNLNVTATDPDSGQIVTLSASGGPFEVNVSPASFSATDGNPATGQFSWQSDCQHIRPQFYQVVFKAEDNFTQGTDNFPLADLETWLIYVIPPPPDTLEAVANGNQIDLSWTNPYTCESFGNFVGFSVWRRIGSNPFDREKCETGLDGKGYTMIAEDLTGHTYIDTDVVRGQNYCYRILAHFEETGPNGQFQFNRMESVPSLEACVELPLNVPIITQVTVDSTDLSTGIITTQWLLPFTDSTGFDTIQNPGPYNLELYQSPGFSGANTLLQTFSSPTFSGLADDTSFTHTALNTVDSPYNYRLIFYAQSNIEIGQSDEASSVYLTVDPSDQRNNLSWSTQVPWTNFEYVVFRRDPGSSVFNVVDTVSTAFYSDDSLINDSLYCYRVLTIGSYTSPKLPDTLFNFSQIACGIPIDTVPPCPPVLSVENDCETIPNEVWTAANFVNRLSWGFPDSVCGADAVKYYIYFQPSGDSVFSLIDSVLVAADTFYSHFLSNQNFGLAGCYRVTALDEYNNQSGFSNTFCIDNCPFYDLPNVFTPNQDGSNELFTPFLPYRFVNRIEMKITNRWGNVIWETEDPMINWDGTDQKSGKAVEEGVYFYTGFYYEERVDGEVKRALPPNGNGGGFIHLVR